MTRRTGPAFVALLTGGCILILFAVIGEHGYWKYHSVPREQAVATAQAPGPLTSRCGKETRPKTDTTYRVTDPRPGFPAQFVHADCPGFAHIGDEVTIARKDRTARPEVTLDPVNGQGDVAVVAVVLGVAAGAFIVLMYWANQAIDAVLRRRKERRARRS